MRTTLLVLIGVTTAFTCRGDILSGPVVNPANGHSYYLLSEDTWQNSEAQAIQLGGHLVTINNQAEQDWVFSIFNSWGGINRSLWIGLSDARQEGLFEWANGEPLVYTHWLPYQPDNAFTGENYVHMCPTNNSNPAAYWNDLASPNTYRPDFGPICGVVEVAGPPLTIEISQVRLCWKAETNRLYQVQYRSELTTNMWINLGAPVPGTGNTKCVFDDVVSPRRFYNVVVLPE